MTHAPSPSPSLGPARTAPRADAPGVRRLPARLWHGGPALVGQHVLALRAAARPRRLGCASRRRRLGGAHELLRGLPRRPPHDRLVLAGAALRGISAASRLHLACISAAPRAAPPLYLAGVARLRRVAARRDAQVRHLVLARAAARLQVGDAALLHPQGDLRRTSPAPASHLACTSPAPAPPHTSPRRRSAARTRLTTRRGCPPRPPA